MHGFFSLALPGRRYIGVVLLLCVCTGLLFGYYPRYQTTGPELLHNTDLTQDLDGWQRSPQGVILPSPGTGLAILTAPDNTSLAHLTQLVPSAQRYTQVRLSADVKTVNVRKGDLYWKKARLILSMVNSAGKHMYYLPHQVTSLSGDHDWAHYSHVFNIDEDAVTISVSAQLSNASGMVYLKNISLRPVEERSAFISYRLALIFAWAIALVWLTLPISRALVQSRAAPLVILLTLAIAAGVMMPETVKKHLDRHVPELLLPQNNYAGAQVLPAMMSQILPQMNIYKIGHFLFFALLAWVLFRNFSRQVTARDLLIYLTVLAVTTEILQLFIDGRGPRVLDVIIDISGAALGAFVASRMIGESTRAPGPDNDLK